MVAAIVIKQEFKKLAETTSIRGIPRALKSSDKGLRVIWASAVLLCLSLLVWQTTTICIRYFSRQSSTLFTQTQTKSVFPDITVCNSYPLNNLDVAVWQSYFANKQSAQNTWTCDKIRNKLNIDMSDDQCSYVWWQLLLPTGLFATLPSFDDGVGDQVLITDCHFYDWDWSESKIDCIANTKTVWDNNYYKCYKIQVPTNQSQTVLGLTAVLYINDFSPTFLNKVSWGLGDTMSSGVRLAVHARGTEPDLARGIDIGPGVETTVQLSLTNRVRLQSPYPSQCTDQTFVTNSSEMLYTALSCYDVCIQSQIIEQCNCVSGFFLFTDYQMKLVNYTLCGNKTSTDDASNTTTSDPLKAFGDTYNLNFNSSINYDSCIDTCKSQCLEYIYDTSVSNSGPSPSVGYQMAFYDKYIDGKWFAGKFKDYEHIITNYTAQNLTEVDAISQLRSLNLIERNFVQLKIIFERINPYQLSDNPSMTIDNLWAQLGGVLSLWLGITIMTAVEVIECIYTLIQQAKKAKKTTTKESFKQESAARTSRVP